MLAIGASAQAADVAPPRAVAGPAQNVGVETPTPGRTLVGQIPLGFEPGRGEPGDGATFQARGRGYGVFLTGPEAVVALTRTHRRAAADQEHVRRAERALVRMRLVGASRAPAAAALDELPGKVNYLIGNDPAKWRTNVPTYGKVRYRAVYPGVDLVYYGNERQLEYDFIVEAGAEPRAITLAFAGVGSLAVNAAGDLVLPVGRGELRLRKPSIYQEVDGVRRPVAGGYELRGRDQVGFQVAAYDATKPLVIDPVLVYSSYLGGLGEDNGSGIFVDATGIYVGGLTVSSNFPIAGSPYQDSIGGDYDAYVAKLNPTGSALIYTTYLGGSGTDFGLGLGVDASGNAYVTGLTGSTDFPLAGAAQGVNGGGFDAFVAKIDSIGSNLLYATYLGGLGTDFAVGIAVDANGRVYLAGRTDSSDWPTAGTPYQADSGGGTDAFVAKLDTTLSGSASLVYSTYLGGSAEDRANGIAVDGTGQAYVTGRTASTDFPMAGTPYQGTNGGGAFDAFVAKLDAAGATLLYSTYLGGGGDDRGLAIARDGSNRVYVTGHTISPDFPVTPGAHDTTCGSDGACNAGFMDVFVAKLDPAAAGAASLVYSTYLGGSRDEEGESIAVDGAGNAHVTGYTDSTDFPVAHAFQPICGVGCGLGFVDAFVSKLDAAGSALTFSTYLGGSSSDYGITIFVDGGGSIYVSGESFSDNFPTVAPYSSTWAGDYDILISKITPTGTAANLVVDKTAAPDPATVGHPLTYTVTVANNGPDSASGVRLIDQLPLFEVSVGSATASQGTCVTVSAFYLEVRCDLGTLAAAADATVTLVVTPLTSGTLSTRATVASNVSDPDGPSNLATRDVAVAFPPTPSVTFITPVSGIAGTSVTINGTGLAAATSVAFNGAPAAITQNTDTQIKADVPAEATTGKIAVTTPGGTATSAATFTVKPNITGFTPASGAVGDSVTIDGTGFGGATAVKFDGKAATLPGSHPVTQIVTTVPANATSGKITVTTPAGTATSATNFIVAPRITSFTPSAGPAGASVVINGANFAGTTSVTFNGVAAAFVINSPIKITATVPGAATTGPIAVTAPAGVGTSASSFTVRVSPSITSFTPDHGPVGATVTINGSNFTGVTAVKLNGRAATIPFKSDTQLRIKVPTGATTGPISVTTPGGTAVSAESFVVAPRIKSFLPGSGSVGTSVTINGANFTGATAVRFNGTPAVFTVNSSVRITATMPAGATTGKLTVTTAAGTATSGLKFTVKP